MIGGDCLKRIIFPLLLSLILLMTACQSKELILVGEGDNGRLEVIVSQTDGDETYRIQLGYKDNDLKTLKRSVIMSNRSKWSGGLWSE